MNENIKAYIESLFEGEPQTNKMLDLKEEMLQNLNDKYNDLIEEGKSPKEAYTIALANMGDVSGLIDQLKGQSAVQASDAQRKKSALLTSAAVMLYILCVIAPIIFNDNVVGPVLMFVMVAAATGLLIYNNMTKPRYNKTDDTIVEKFREWHYKDDRKNQLYKALSSAIWTVTLAVYLIVSFLTMAWHITWVIFLISSALNAVLKAIFDLNDI